MKRKITRRRSRNAVNDWPVKAVSASRLGEYEICPGKTFFSIVKKIRLAPTEPMRRGSAIHEMGQAYLERGRDELPDAFRYLAAEMKALRAKKPLCEEEYAFDAAWSRVGWFDDAVRWRMKIDALVLNAKSAVAIDFKTGKEREKDHEQIELYALAVLQAHPEIQRVKCALWYTNTGEMPEFIVTRRELPGLLNEWEPRAEKMLSDRELLPVKNRLCDWCGFSSKKDGPCKVG